MWGFKSESDVEAEKLLSLSQVAEVLGLCVRSVRRLVDRGVLPRPVRVGRAVRLFKSDVDGYLEGLRKTRST